MPLPELLQKIKQERGTLKGADLVGADLKDADLRAINLEGANLRYAMLSGADLRRSNLRGANLRHAVMRKSDLRETDLSKADFSEADISGAKVGRTRLAGARLVNVTGLSKRTFFADQEFEVLVDQQEADFDGDRLAFDDHGVRMEFNVHKAIRIIDFVDGKDPDDALIGQVRTPTELQKFNAKITRHGLVIGDAFYATVTGYIGVPQSRATEDNLYGPAEPKLDMDASATTDADLMSTFLSKQ